MRTLLAALLAAWLPAQTVTITNPAPVRHFSWAEVSLPAGDNPPRVTLTSGGHRFDGFRVFSSPVADHYLILVDLEPHEVLVGKLSPASSEQEVPPFVVHPAVSLLQIVPITVEVVDGTGDRVILPRVPIDGSDFVVVEQNPARLVIQARYSNGELHSDTWAYVANGHPAVRVQTEVHYSALLEGRQAVEFPAREVRFHWANTPSPVRVFSDVAALEGWDLLGSTLRWRPAFTPHEFRGDPQHNPPRENRLGWGERVLFDGVLLFGNRPEFRGQRDAARYGPVRGLPTDAWAGKWNALGGIPPKPTRPAVDLDWRSPGNAYSSRWLAAAFATNMPGAQESFGQGGLGPAIALLEPGNIRACRLSAVDEALRPALHRERTGALVRIADHWPATGLFEGQPIEGFYGLESWPKVKHGASGRRYYDDEHVRHRDISALLHVSVDYQLRSVARQLFQVDRMNVRMKRGWWGGARNGGRRLLSTIEVGRLFAAERPQVLAYCARMLAIHDDEWKGGEALQANPDARELVTFAGTDPRNGVVGAAWVPWEEARVAAGAYAAYRYCRDNGDPEQAERWRVRAWRIARTVCISLTKVDGQWRVPYRVTYAGGVEVYPVGWFGPDAETVNMGNADWIVWSLTALHVYDACEDLATRPADAALLRQVRQVLPTVRKPRTWSDSHWMAGVGS